MSNASRTDPLRVLLAAPDHGRPDDLPRLVELAAEPLGAALIVVYIVDYDQLQLCPMLHGLPDMRRDVLTIEGSLAGRAYSTVSVQESTSGAGTTLWIPLLDGADRLGVVEIVLSKPLDDHIRTECNYLVRLIGELSSTRALYGDAIESMRRKLPMSAATELQRTLLPPLTFATRDLVIAGALVPSYDVAGDCYDYAVNDDIAHIAILDAMGHAMEATLLTAVAVSTYRNARRSGLDLLDTARSVDRWIAKQFEGEKFVTGIIGELNVRTGVWRWVTAGHPATLVLRRGQVVKTLDQVINPPFGLIGEIDEVVEERLQPGDRLVLYSDGVTDARDPGGEFFGADRLVDFVTRYAADGLPAPETLRRLTRAILAHQHGHLDDDATVVLIEWAGESPDSPT